MTERKPLISARDCAAVTGLSARFFQKAAKAGKLPFATQPGGTGSAILFDPDGLDKWIAAGCKSNKGKAIWQKSTGETGRRGRGRRSKAWNTESPLEQRLREKLKSVSRPG